MQAHAYYKTDPPAKQLTIITITKTNNISQ